MKRVILILVLFCAAIALSDTDEIINEEVKTFSERKGKIKVYPIHVPNTPEGTSADGKKGTWDYDENYLYIWITDELVMRVALESFGQSRIRTVEDNLPIETVSGDHLRTVGNYNLW